jgi:hypothetical protein
MNRNQQLVTSDEAAPATSQHTRPCRDCPWSRDAVPGWLGGVAGRTWVAEAHGDAAIDCHTRRGAQCAGAAIYRANVCKVSRDPAVLRLPRDRDAAFDHPEAFLEHHHEGGR